MKSYISKSVLFFKIKIGEKVKKIIFSPYSTGGGEYLTDDKEEQTALENHPFYGDLYMLKDSPIALPNQIKLTAIEGITKCIDARAYLVEKGVKCRLLSKDEIRQAGQDIGVEFPDLL